MMAEEAGGIAELEARQHMAIFNIREVMRRRYEEQAYAQANEVVNMATQQAQEILDNATVEANSVKASAIQYTDDILANLEQIIENGINIANTHYGQLLDDLNSCLNVVQSNRMELRPDEIDDTSSLPDMNVVDPKEAGDEVNLDLM